MHVQRQLAGCVRGFLQVIDPKVLVRKECKPLVSVNFSDQPGDTIMSIFDEQMYLTSISMLLWRYCSSTTRRENP